MIRFSLGQPPSFAQGVLLGVVLAMASAVALAHARLVTAEPADGARLAAPPVAVILSFSERIEPRFSTFTLYEVASKATAEAILGGSAALAKQAVGMAVAVDGSTVRLPIMAPVTSGHYAVVWRVLSVDGYTTAGVIRFTVE